MRTWHLYDAQHQTLGRLATQIAEDLMGKNKPGYRKHEDKGDYVVVINSEKIQVTGRKETQKIYDRYSGFPSGRKQRTLKQVRQQKPQAIITEAVRGMLPKNKLQSKMMTRLKVVIGDENPYADKFANNKQIS